MSLPILVVEDDPKSRRLLCDVIAAQGHEVVSETRGEDAVDRARGAALALVLLDIHLPGIDGFEALARLRALPGHESLPIVAVTASLMAPNRARIAESGFNALVEKPVRLKRLKEVLEQFVHD